MYLNEAEYLTFSGLPGSKLSKTRYSVPPFGVDVFTGNLTGLTMAEVEFENTEDEEKFQVPSEAVTEVTTDARFSGGRLALTDRNGLLLLLTEFGLRPRDDSELTDRALTEPR
jgi:CYTH domain-containing protein